MFEIAFASFLSMGMDYENRLIMPFYKVTISQMGLMITHKLKYWLRLYTFGFGLPVVTKKDDFTTEAQKPPNLKYLSKRTSAL